LRTVALTMTGTETHSPSPAGTTDPTPRTEPGLGRFLLWSRARKPLAALAAALAMLAVGAVLDAFHRERNEERTRSLVLAQAAAVAGGMEDALNSRLFLMRALVGLAAQNPDITQDEFVRLAAKVSEGIAGIRSLALAPDAVVTRLYPVAGNERAFGHDLRADSARRPAIEEAIAARAMRIQGPVKLLQGGNALIAREPVFLPAPDGSGERFWGLAAVVVDFDVVMAEGGLGDSRVTRGFDLALRGKDGKGAAGEAFWGPAELFAPGNVLLNIQLPAGEWQLAARPKGGWTTVDHDVTVLRAVIAFLAVTLGAVAWLAIQAAERRREVEARLWLAKKMESLGNLAGGMAHEINNQLVPIIMLTDEVAEGLPPGSPARARLESVLKAADYVKGLVERITAFSGTEKPRAPVQLAPVVRGVLDLLRPTLPPTVEVREALAAEPVEVVASPAQVQVALMDLAANARDALAGTPGWIEIGLALAEVPPDVARLAPALAGGGRCALIRVADNGPGMSEEVQGRIFDPFFTTKPVGKGAGLGLSAVHGIVLDHGGLIRVRSAPGAGTAFEIFLPLHRAAARAA
jgi:sensor domain CHASE-containing protein